MKQPVLDLKPTQFAVGMREVHKKIHKLKEMKDDERHDFLHEHPVPVVLWAKEFFITDHHHLVRACWEMGLEEIPVESKADFSHLSRDEFWKVLEESRWSHLYDQFGQGPHDPRLLPENVRGLADDPYRSLAWQLRRDGGWEKSDQPFAEFAWAQYLRSKITVEPGNENFDKAAKQALAIARSADAKDLPGALNHTGKKT